MADLQREWPRFKYKGPGWYETTTDTMLVWPALGADTDNYGKVGPDHHLVWCWNVRDQRAAWIKAMAEAAAMPIRKIVG